MSYVPDVVRFCGFNSSDSVRAAAKRNGRIVVPMKRDEELSKLLKSWGVEEPIEF